jgi:alkylhydroperoxidase family enzyme
VSTGSARAPLISDDAATAEVARIFDGARDLLAFVSNFTRTASHVPALARWLVPMIASIQRGGPDSELDPRIKELAILRTSTLNRCFF